MTRPKDTLTAAGWSMDDLRNAFDLDRKSGVLLHKPRPETTQANRHFNKLFAGKAAGYSNGIGYLCVSIGGFETRAHRVVYALCHGFFPLDPIDHINGVRSDNRPENLRLATPLLNMKNRRKPKNNTSGFCGVEMGRRGKWVVRISTDAGRITVGSFDKLADAVKARKDAERRFGYHENHGDGPINLGALT